MNGLGAVAEQVEREFDWPSDPAAGASLGRISPSGVGILNEVAQSDFGG
jgi:hypothetical protein